MAESDRLSQLLDIARAIAREPDTARLIERILLAAKDAARADGGSVYLVEDSGRRLAFALLLNDTLRIRGGWAAGTPLSIDAPPLYKPGGAPNHASVVAHCVHSRRAVRLEDAYTAEGFDFEGARAFDAVNHYRSRSFLTVPMIDQSGEVIGVLQLVNARAADGSPATFDADDQAFTEGLAALAAIVLEKQRLIERLGALVRPATDATAGDTPSPPAGAA
ncbi:MAG TPA: GAF domain-containing protein [Casimicrobiaceae bacterium]|nr:GAF domain-containing protein [Casimicrobiaceae bacterium]